MGSNRVQFPPRKPFILDMCGGQPSYTLDQNLLKWLTFSIKLPEILQNFGNNADLLEKWLQQMATVRTEIPKERYYKQLQIQNKKNVKKCL